MDKKSISYTVDQEGIAILTLSRPHALNALTAQMCQELYEVLKEVDQSDNVRALLITGEGRAFCTGLDISELKESYDDTLEPFYRHLEAANQLIVQLSELHKPLVMAVNGVAAASGMNMILTADIAVASDQATFSQSFGNVGLIPDVGGTYLLPRIVGVPRAKEIIFMDRKLNAQEALDLGIVHQLVPPSQVVAAAYEMAQKLSSGPSFAFSVAKKMLSCCNEMDIHTALHMEALSQVLVSNVDDYREGVDAFLEKRRPVFSRKR